MKLVIVIPAFNEASIISTVLSKIPKKIEGISSIVTVVVNDGSSDLTPRKAKNKNVVILNHLLNRGAGAATKTGLIYAKSISADIVVTFDADGQHEHDDIKKIVKPIIMGRAELVIGSRFLKKQKIPTDRFILNKGANILTFLLFGVFSSDSQSGLRAFSKKAIDLIDFKSDRMEFSSEILLEAKRNNIKITEIPTRAIYTDYSKAKGQKNTNALPIFIRFLVKLLR